MLAIPEVNVALNACLALLISGLAVQGEPSQIFGGATTMEEESLFFYKTDDKSSATSHLLFPADHITKLTSRLGDIVYEEGKDFTLGDDRVTVTLTPTSRIPFHTPADMYLKPHDPMGISHKLGDPNTWLLWGKNAFPFQHTQCVVTYDHKPGLWAGYVPQFAGDVLPKTMAKLKNKQPLTIGVSGDSISFGYDSTLADKLPPFRPPFFVQVTDQLKSYYGGPITLKNRGVPGWSATNGLKDLPNLIALKPDLIFIAYGMNDVGGNNAPGYRTNVKALIDQINKELPDTEIILVSTMIGNPEWVVTPRERFPAYRDQLKTLAGPGIAFVDITAVWEELLKHKAFWDITGNGVNHPNDFSHRIYTEMILRLLLPPDQFK